MTVPKRGGKYENGWSRISGIEAYKKWTEKFNTKVQQKRFKEEENISEFQGGLVEKMSEKQVKK